MIVNEGDIDSISFKVGRSMIHLCKEKSVDKTEISIEDNF
jgi:hypothetical protein